MRRLLTFNREVAITAVVIGMLVVLGLALGPKINREPVEEVHAGPSSSSSTSVWPSETQPGLGEHFLEFLAAYRHGLTHRSTLSSTAYCLTTPMASGRRPYVGAVAANRYRIGTRLRVDRSPTGPGVFVVEDRSASGATDIDFAVPGACGLAERWGRRPVHVEVVR